MTENTGYWTKPPDSALTKNLLLFDSRFEYSPFLHLSTDQSLPPPLCHRFPAWVCVSQSSVSLRPYRRCCTAFLLFPGIVSYTDFPTQIIFECLLLSKFHRSERRLGGSVSWASNFSSGHDLAVHASRPASGSVLTAQSLELASDSVFPSLLALPHSCSVSVSQKWINMKKIFLIKNN